MDVGLHDVIEENNNILQNPFCFAVISCKHLIDGLGQLIYSYSLCRMQPPVYSDDSFSFGEQALASSSRSPSALAIFTELSLNFSRLS